MVVVDPQVYPFGRISFVPRTMQYSQQYSTELPPARTWGTVLRTLLPFTAQGVAHRQAHATGQTDLLAQRAASVNLPLQWRYEEGDPRAVVEDVPVRTSLISTLLASPVAASSVRVPPEHSGATSEHVAAPSVFAAAPATARGMSDQSGSSASSTQQPREDKLASPSSLSESMPDWVSVIKTVENTHVDRLSSGTHVGVKQSLHVFDDGTFNNSTAPIDLPKTADVASSTTGASSPKQPSK